MPGVAGGGTADGEAVRVQALKNTRTGFNFLRPGFAVSLTPFTRTSVSAVFITTDLRYAAQPIADVSM